MRLSCFWLECPDRRTGNVFHTHEVPEALVPLVREAFNLAESLSALEYYLQYKDGFVPPQDE